MHFTTDDVDPAQYEAVEGLLEMLRAADPRQRAETQIERRKPASGELGKQTVGSSE
jgi:hypothetical protein